MSIYSRVADLQARGQPAPLLLMVDLAAALIAFSLSALLRSNLTIANQSRLELEIPIGVYLAIALAWILGGTLLGLYRSERPNNSRDVLFLLVANALINLLAVFAVSVFSMPMVPRLIYVFFLVFLICLLFLLRATLQIFAASPLHSRLSKVALGTWNRLKEVDKVLYLRRADLIFVAAFSLFWVVLNYLAGFIYSPDSVEYITMAANLRYSGDAAFLPYWPPLFPLVIALASFFIPYPASAGMVVVSVSAVGVLLVFSLIVRRILRSSLLAVIAYAILVGTAIFLNVATTVWSEMPFLFFVLLGMWFVLRYSESGSHLHIYLALTFSGLAALTRYIGSVQLVSTSLLVIWLSWRAGRKIPLLPLLISNSFFALILALLSLRNNGLYGEGWFDTWMGPPGNIAISLPRNLSTAWQIFSRDFGWAQTALIAIGLVYFISRVKKGVGVGTVVLVLVPAVYLSALFYSSSVYPPVFLDSRLLFPAYAPLIAFGIWGGVEVIQSALQAKNQFARYFVPLLLLCLIGFSFANNSRWFLEHIGETMRHAGEPDLHFDDGYSLSSTARGLARTAELALENSDLLNIFVLVTPETYGRIFLLQADVYRYLDLSSIRYTYLGEDYSVFLETDGGSHKQINYWFLSASKGFYSTVPQDPEALIPQIEQRLAASPGENLVLFLINEQNEIVWQLVLDELSRQYDIKVMDVPPYATAFFSSR